MVVNRSEPCRLRQSFAFTTGLHCSRRDLRFALDWPLMNLRKGRRDPEMFSKSPAQSCTRGELLIHRMEATFEWREPHLFAFRASL